MGQPIVVFSVQHTGTWFVLEALKKLTKRRLLLIDKLPASRQTVEFIGSCSDAIIHRHLHLDEPLVRIDVSKPPFGGELAYFNYNKQVYREVVATLPCVVTLRDPLLSTITRHNRHPGRNHEYIIEGFRFLAETSTDEKQPFYFRVDIEPSGRRPLLAALSEYVNIDPDEETFNSIMKWHFVNTTRDNSRLKFAYAQGNINAVQNALANECNLLRKYSPRILPFLHKIGYRNLPWSSCPGPDGVTSERCVLFQ